MSGRCDRSQAPDRDKVWIKVDGTTCRPAGAKLYLEGSWVDIGANLFYGVDVSSVDNTVQVDSTSPTVNWAQTGHVFMVKFGRPNSGAAVATIKNSGVAFYSSVPIRKFNNQPLDALDFIAGMIGVLVYDGVTNTLRLTNPLSSASGSPGTGGGSVSSGGFNLSFDDDLNEDDIPDQWNVFVSNAAFTGAVGEAETAPSSGTPAYELDSGVHGGKCIKFTCLSGVGNGGGFIQTAGHIPITGGKIQEFSWWVKTADSIANRVEMLWYDDSKTYLSKTELWFNNASNPNGTWFQHGGIASPPSSARFCRIRLYAGVSGSPAGGHVWFDDFRFEAPTFSYQCQHTTVSAAYRFKAPPGKFQMRAMITAGGGGGGGIGASAVAPKDPSGGGGGGGTVIAYLPITPNSDYALTIGAGGTAGANTPTDGGTGGASSLVVGSCTLAPTGGAGGIRTNGADSGLGGAAGSGTVTSWGVVIPGTVGYPLSAGQPRNTAPGYGGDSALGSGGCPAVGAAGMNGMGFGIRRIWNHVERWRNAGRRSWRPWSPDR